MVTDGATSMVGKNRGLVSRVKEIAPQMHALHCLIHQSVLCASVTVVSHFISPLLAENRSIQESLRQALGPVSKVLECSSSVPATERLS